MPNRETREWNNLWQSQRYYSTITCRKNIHAHNKKNKVYGGGIGGMSAWCLDLEGYYEDMFGG